MHFSKLLTKICSKIASKSKSLLSKCHLVKRRSSKKPSIKLSFSYGNVLSAKLQIHDYVIVDEDVVLWEDVVESVRPLYRESLVSDVWNAHLDVLFERASHFSYAHDKFYLEELFREQDKDIQHNAGMMIAQQSNNTNSVSQTSSTVKAKCEMWYDVSMQPEALQTSSSSSSSAGKPIGQRPRQKCMLVSIHEYDEEKVKAFFSSTWLDVPLTIFEDHLRFPLSHYHPITTIIIIIINKFNNQIYIYIDDLTVC